MAPDTKEHDGHNPHHPEASLNLDRTAFAHELFPALYPQLRRLARSKLAAGGRHTLLDTHALVHEAYLRMQPGGGKAARGTGSQGSRTDGTDMAGGASATGRAGGAHGENGENGENGARSENGAGGPGAAGETGLSRGGLVLADREHFLAYAASTMRSVIIDFVRRRNALRRGGDVEHVTLDTRAAEQLGASDGEILAVHEALALLANVDERLVQVVEMRYFGGLTDAEIGAALGVTDRTVRRDWERARLLLAQVLGR